jgi:hypothetical protein
MFLNPLANPPATTSVELPSLAMRFPITAASLTTSAIMFKSSAIPSNVWVALIRTESSAPAIRSNDSVSDHFPVDLSFSINAIIYLF